MFGLHERKLGQSAIEYLMTYGWAILIIGIVLAILFKLNVFSSASLLGISCTGVPGFLCANPVLNTSGQLSIDFGQISGSPYYNVALSCSAGFNSTGLPNNGSSWTMIPANGLGVPISQVSNVPGGWSNAVVLISTQSLSMRGIKCYDATGMPLPASSPVGTTFSGSIFVNYTTSPCTPNTAGCTPLITKAATVTARVV